MNLFCSVTFLLQEGSQLFIRVDNGKTNGLKLKEGGFRLNVRKKL